MDEKLIDIFCFRYKWNELQKI